MTTTLVFATDAALTHEMVSAGKALGGDVVVAALGPLAAEAKSLGAGAKKVLTAKGPGLDEFHAGATACVLQQIIEKVGATRVVVGGNRRGKELAPRLAARLGASYIALAIEIKDGQFKRKYLGGRTIATEKPELATVVVTVPPHVFEPASGAEAPVEDAGVEVPPGRVQRVSLKAHEGGEVNIEEADIVVAFGRGVKKKDDMKLVFDLAAALGGEVGCSRPISADLHWLGDERWIGLSGKNVKPKLYIAVGVSGQIQHLAGCRDAGVMVVINTDKGAPFFEHADYGLVGDLYKVVPALIAAAKK